jgi:hypothetical protein
MIMKKYLSIAFVFALSLGFIATTAQAQTYAFGNLAAVWVSDADAGFDIPALAPGLLWRKSVLTAESVLPGALAMPMATDFGPRLNWLTGKMISTNSREGDHSSGLRECP